MKKMLAVVSLALTMPLVAEGVEFQTPGSVGIGGAGVARNNGALTSYWNPAGAAFSKSTLAVNAGAGFGIRASDGLTENIDLLSTIDFDNVKDFNTTSAGAKEVGDVVKTLSILNDIKTRQGNIAINVIAPVSFSIKNISFGIYGGMEGYVQPVADMDNIRPNTEVAGTTLTVTDLVTAAAATTAYTTPVYFSQAQFDALTSAHSDKLASAIDTQLKDSGIDPATAFSTINATFPQLTGANTNTLNKNTTSVMTKAFQYIEIPLSYGHPFDIGKKGKLGLGITGKVIKGTVYQNEVLLVNGQDNVDAKDIINDITENKKSSSAIGIDIGALYKYENWLNIGLVAKNINSPKFEAPDYFTPKYNTSTDKIELSERVAGSAVELKPQIRTGVAIEPVGWMTLAADLDLSENDTVAPGSVVGSSIKSRNFGGGFEVKPASWLKVRGGAYKNLAQSNGSVLTAGFKLFLLDVDGAMATNTFTIDGNELPREVKVNASMSFSF